MQISQFARWEGAVMPINELMVANVGPHFDSGE